MRVNKVVVLLTIMVMLSPALSVLGVSQELPEETTFTPSSVFNASVGVEVGDLIYWDLDQLTLPESLSPSEDFPDLAGNQIYMKITDIFEDEVAPGVDDKIIFFSLGFKFLSDLAFTAGSPPLETEMIIPAGAVTPSVGIYAVPHMNQTYGFGPLVVILNDAWNDHETLFEYMGYTVTNGVDDFEIEAINGTGTWTATWRKSDGICTNMLIDDIWWQGLNFTGATIELSFNSLENNPLPITIGDNIELTMDTIQADVTGSGVLWDSINETELNEEIAEYEDLEGKTIEKLVVEYIHGTFYGCGVYVYNTNTETLEKIPDFIIIWNGFQFTYQIAEPFQFNDLTEDIIFFGGVFAPWITPDWDIYAGQAELFNTFIGTYLTDIIQLMGIEADEAVYHSIAGSFELETKKGFYYFYEAVEWDIEENLSYSSIITIMNPNELYVEGMTQHVEQQGYISYTEEGICASMHIKVESETEYYDTSNATAEGTGTISFSVEVKLRNVDYDPPELIRGGILPGFTWMAAFPALLGIGVVSIYIRRRKR
jgi:hypothetical protein